MRLFLDRTPFDRQPFFTELKYQTIRIVKQLTAETFQTIRSVSGLIGSAFQTVRMVMNEFTFYHTETFQTMRVIRVLFGVVYQTIRNISLWVLPTNLYGKFKREGKTLEGRFKRK